MQKAVFDLSEEDCLEMLEKKSMERGHFLPVVKTKTIFGDYEIIWRFESSIEK